MTVVRILVARGAVLRKARRPMIMRTARAGHMVANVGRAYCARAFVRGHAGDAYVAIYYAWR